MGGLKRKIDTGKKIDGKNPRAVAFSKRRKGLFNKASELCLLSDAQIAILATPISSNSHASFYSFGHSSVDNVVSAFLAGQTPRRDEDDDDDEKLGFWWEDESLGNSQNPEELGCAIDSMRKMLHDLKELKNKQRDRVDVTHQQQTLDHQPCSSSLCLELDDVSVNGQGFQDNTVNNVDDLTVNVQGFQNNTDEEQTLPNNDGLLGSFDGCNQEFDLDQLYDFMTKSEDLWKDMEMYDDCVDVEKEKGGSHVTHQQQTLDHQPCSSSLFVDIDDDVSVNVQGFHNNNTEEQQTLAVSGSFDEELDVDDIWKNLDLDDLSVSLQVFQNNVDEEQTLANDDGLHGSFDGCNQEFDVDQLYDFVTNSEGLWKGTEMYNDCLY